MSRPARAAGEARRGSFGSLAIFVFGVPLGVGILIAISGGAVGNAELRRYVNHPVEQAEVVLFCCALCALAGKLLGWFRERTVLGSDIIPEWDGKPVPIAEAKKLRQQLELQSSRAQQTYLGKRIASVIDYVDSRGS